MMSDEDHILRRMVIPANNRTMTVEVLGDGRALIELVTRSKHIGFYLTDRERRRVHRFLGETDSDS
jgi:hypothetical protein